MTKLSQGTKRLKTEINTVGGHKLDHLAINSTTAVAVEARVTPTLPATVVVEFMARWWSILYQNTVLERKQSRLKK